MGKSWRLPMNGGELQYGVAALPELYEEWSAPGMVANIGTKIVEVAYGKLVLEATLTAEAHGFPTPRGPIVHGGAIATIADEALGSVAFTHAEQGETTRTPDPTHDCPQHAERGSCRRR